ncbi:MAG: hypothetical protein M1840_001775 [Geoglossum simile]|nr:MAG: hypothetical protein M1840_001775 [Geoglossum simile]
MPFFALLKRSKIAREQSADRDGGGRSSKRTKRGVLRELFRWNTGARKPERQSDVEALPPLLEVVVSSDDGSEQRPSVPFTAIGLKPASQKKTLTDDDFHKLFSGAPQFSLLKPPDALRPPQPRVTFPWDTDPRIHDLTDCARFPHPVFSLSTTQPYPPPTDDAASGEGRQSGAQTGYDIGVVEVPSAISAQGLELGTVGYEYLMMLPFADMLEELVDEEAGSSDDDGEVGGRTAMWRRRRLLREGPEGGKRIGLRSIETNVIATRLQELGHLYHGSEDRDSTRAPLDLLKEQSSVQLYAQLFTRILYPPDRVHNADADDPYSLKVQIEALVKALSAARIWHDFSIVETRLRLGELLFGDPTLSVAGAGAERRWLLLQILLSCELLVRLDAVAGSSGQELARSTLEGLVGFYGVGRGKIEWDIMLARRWLENVRLAIGGAIEAGNHNRNDSNSNPAISPSLATTQDPTAKKKGTSWSWFSQNPSQTPAAALQPPTDTDPDDIPIMATWRNPQRQISGLLYFAETLGWPGVDTLRQELEVRTREGLGVPISLGADKNAEEHTTTTTIHTPSWPLDTYLTSLILPGPSLSHHLMASLLPSPFPPTATNIGLIHLGKSYWNKNSIVGKVLAGVSGAKEVGGWIAGVELNIEGAEEGWIAAGPEEQSREIPPSSTTTTDLAPSARELRIPPPPPPQPQMQNITLTLTPSTATLTLPPFPALPLLHNPTFLTAFPCVLPPHPLSTHIPYSFTPLNPYPPPPPHAARNHILILDARRGAGTGAEVLARAWCAAVGLAVVLVAREARGACLACAVREGWVVGGGESGEGGVVVVWV